LSSWIHKLKKRTAVVFVASGSEKQQKTFLKPFALSLKKNKIMQTVEPTKTLSEGHCFFFVFEGNKTVLGKGSIKN